MKDFWAPRLDISFCFELVSRSLSYRLLAFRNKQPQGKYCKNSFSYKSFLIDLWVILVILWNFAESYKFRGISLSDQVTHFGSGFKCPPVRACRGQRPNTRLARGGKPKCPVTQSPIGPQTAMVGRTFECTRRAGQASGTSEWR